MDLVNKHDVFCMRSGQLRAVQSWDFITDSGWNNQLKFSLLKRRVSLNVFPKCQKLSSFKPKI